MLQTPSGPKFLHFHVLFRNKWSNSMLVIPLKGWHPSLGNPGSATGRSLTLKARSSAECHMVCVCIAANSECST